MIVRSYGLIDWRVWNRWLLWKSSGPSSITRHRPVKSLLAANTIFSNLTFSRCGKIRPIVTAVDGWRYSTRAFVSLDLIITGLKRCCFWSAKVSVISLRLYVVPSCSFVVKATNCLFGRRTTTKRKPCAASGGLGKNDWCWKDQSLIRNTKISKPKAAQCWRACLRFERISIFLKCASIERGSGPSESVLCRLQRFTRGWILVRYNFSTVSSFGTPLFLFRGTKNAHVTNLEHV